MTDDSLIDMEWLRRHYQGDTEQLLQIYLRENDDCITRIREALEKKDLEDVKAVAHKMKGSSRIIGAFSIEKLADQIENLPLDHEYRHLVEDLQIQYGKIRQKLIAILGS